MSGITLNQKLARSNYSRYYRLAKFIDFMSHLTIGDEDECWEWQGGIKKDGYGYFLWGKKGIRYAHIAAYEFFIGKRHGKCVCHSCDNPPCCNPSHLWLGTNKQNSVDMVVKGRQSKGEKHWAAKLTLKEVMKIRKLYKTGIYTHSELAVKFGVSSSHISNLLRKQGGKWKG